MAVSHRRNRHIGEDAEDLGDCAFVVVIESKDPPSVLTAREELADSLVPLERPVASVRRRLRGKWGRSVRTVAQTSFGTTLTLIVNFTAFASLNCDFWNPRTAKCESLGSEYGWPLPRNPVARRVGPNVVLRTSANSSWALAGTQEACLLRSQTARRTAGRPRSERSVFNSGTSARIGT